MAKINDIRFLARETAKEVSGSPQDWMGYLDTASRLYRYPFSDTFLIHAQRPDATACAELEVWNEKMRRWVKRGAKGIALIDDTGPRRALRYVFDVSDTHPVRGGKTPYLWRMKEEQQEMILNHLADTYGLDGDGASDLAAALRQIAEEMAADSLEEAMDGIGYAIPGTFLEGLDDDTIRVEFHTLLANSAFYSLARRCGLEPMEYLEEADFSSITDYNDLSVLAFLPAVYNLLDLPETFLTDYMFDPAGILRSHLLVHPDHLGQEAGQDQVSLIDRIGFFAAFLGQQDPAVFLHCDQAVFFQDPHCPADTGLAVGKFIGDIDRTHRPILILQHQDGFQVVLSGFTHD